MKYPEFYSKVPSIKLHDPLSGFLGAFEGGELEISYLECAKLAGHSCPTVAGAYLVAQKGLEALFADETPKRGSIRVEMRDSEDSGVTGVIATVISFITGASGAGGFKGIKGNFARNSLLSYNNSINAEVKLTRLDTMASVNISYDPSTIPADANLMPLMGKNMQNLASDEEKKMFGILWQKRVEDILLSVEKHNQIITITKD